MAHVLFIGMTQSGKTTLAKRLAHEYVSRGISVIILDPLNDPGWPTQNDDIGISKQERNEGGKDDTSISQRARHEQNRRNNKKDRIGNRQENDEGNIAFQTRDKNQFLQIVRASRSCAVFIDEAGECVGQYDSEMHWLATRARHYGHQCHFLSQRGQQIAKTVRDQCSKMFLFCCSKTDGKLLADEWNKEDLNKVNELGRGEFFVVSRFDPLRRGTINFDTGKITMNKKAK